MRCGKLSRASVAVRALADSQTSQVPRRHSLHREGWAVLWRAGKVGCWLEGRTGRPTLTHRHTGEEKFSGKHLCPAASVKVKCSTLNRAGLGPPDRTSTTSSLVLQTESVYTASLWKWTRLLQVPPKEEQGSAFTIFAIRSTLQRNRYKNINIFHFSVVNGGYLYRAWTIRRILSRVLEAVRAKAASQTSQA